MSGFAEIAVRHCAHAMWLHALRSVAVALQALHVTSLLLQVALALLVSRDDGQSGLLWWCLDGRAGDFCVTAARRKALRYCRKLLKHHLPLLQERPPGLLPLVVLADSSN